MWSEKLILNKVIIPFKDKQTKRKIIEQHNRHRKPHQRPKSAQIGVSIWWF